MKVPRPRRYPFRPIVLPPPPTFEVVKEGEVIYLVPLPPDDAA